MNPAELIQIIWCIFSCPLLVQYSSDIQLLLLELQEIEE